MSSCPLASLPSTYMIPQQPSVLVDISDVYLNQTGTVPTISQITGKENTPVRNSKLKPSSSSANTSTTKRSKSQSTYKSLAKQHQQRLLEQSSLLQQQPLLQNT